MFVAMIALLLSSGMSGSIATVTPQNPAKWEAIQIDFSGPTANESSNNPNPFLDYRLQLELTAPSGKSYDVPGFFAGNGSGGGSGKVWRVRFSADEVGTWSYEASFRSGNDVAISQSPTAGSPASFDGESGSFSVGPVPGQAKGLLAGGRLEYVNGHYLKQRDGDYWLKGGVNSPENFLGYAGFDNTSDSDSGQFCKGNDSGMLNGLHGYAPHVSDFRNGDPLFENDGGSYDSKGIIGALNYLEAQKANSLFFLPLNLGGDACDTHPFLSASGSGNDNTRYDVSKLRQWNMVLNHAQEAGIQIQFVFAEAENENKTWLDGGQLGTERKLFYREMAARFSYLMGVKWNLMEENEYSPNKLRSFAEEIQAWDWAKHPIAFHTKRIRDNSGGGLGDYESTYGDPEFSAASLQVDAGVSGDVVETVRASSAAAGRPWIVDMDEVNGGVATGRASEIRKTTLYDVYFGGGHVEWYSKGGDQNLEDFADLAEILEYTWYARKFMEEKLPFWEMQPGDQLLSGEASANGGGEVFYKADDVYAIYLPDASPSGSINLSSLEGQATLSWYNPRTGAFQGQEKSVNGGGTRALGSPPSQANEDWVVLISKFAGVGVNNPPVLDPIGDQLSTEDVSVSLTLNATDVDGDDLTWSVTGLPSGLSFSQSQTRISGAPQETGSFTVTVTVSDGEDQDAESFTWSVTEVIEPGGDVLIDADFSNGVEGFGYVDDAFRSTSQPSYASGQWESSPGQLAVKLGGINNSNISGMSGGWQIAFSLSESADVDISFAYRVYQSSQYEDDERSQALFELDGELFGVGDNDYLAEVSGGGSTSWNTYSLTIPDMAAGPHTMVLGGYNSRKTYNNEVTTILIDDVLVTKEGDINPGPSGPIFRVNAGGDERDADDGSPLSWDEDTNSNPSEYGNASAARSRAGGTSVGITLPPNFPPSVPRKLFNSERIDRSNGANMKWTFPVSSGSDYIVRLYFMERISSSGPGDRVFDVAIEGTISGALDNLDVVATAGGVRIPMYVETVATAQGSTLDIEMVAISGLPIINGIEILAVEEPGQSAKAPEDDALTGPSNPRLELTSIYPNPVGTSGYVDFSLPAPGTAQVLVMDAVGRIVKDVYNGIGTVTRRQLTVDTSDLASGVYFLVLESASGRVVTPFVRSR